MMEFFYEDDHRPASPIHPIEAVKKLLVKDRRPWGEGFEIGILEFLLVLLATFAITVRNRYFLQECNFINFLIRGGGITRYSSL